MPRHEHHQDRPVSREQIAHALSLWRDANHQMEGLRREERRAEYELAITAGLSFLRRFTTMQALVRSYFDDVTDDEGKDPFEQAVHRLPSGRILNYGVVEDASYFRRAQELIAQTSTQDPPDAST